MSPTAPATRTVRIGIERLIEEDRSLVTGARVALVSNPASIDRGSTPSAPEKLGTARTIDPAGPAIVQEPARWQVVVDTAGRVAWATLLTATHYPDLAQATQANVMRLRFHPALDDRVPVAVVDTIDYAISGVGR